MNNDPDRRDHKAEFGRQPKWNLQRKKQDEAAARFYDEPPEECPECGYARIIGDEKVVCGKCGYEVSLRDNE